MFPQMASLHGGPLKLMDKTCLETGTILPGTTVFSSLASRVLLTGFIWMESMTTCPAFPSMVLMGQAITPWLFGHLEKSNLDLVGSLQSTMLRRMRTKASIVGYEHRIALKMSQALHPQCTISIKINLCRLAFQRPAGRIG